MRFLVYAWAAATACVSFTTAQSTAGIRGILERRLPAHADDFTLSLVNATDSTNATSTTKPADTYMVSNGHSNGTINISGNSPIALASGLRWYLTTYCQVDIWWFLGSKLHLAPSHLPAVNQTYEGSSIVPWRYHFNTVTFSYTAAWWDWDDWELELDWLALHGVNLPLAWVGYEKILLDVLLEAGFSEGEIISFLSGPAFQSWNRFGNIRGSWGGELPMSWINSQFELQKKIVARMVELGMTPVLPAFTGFVPRAIESIYPNASVVNGSKWSGFPETYTNVSFLEPFDSLFAELQESFISKQADAYGNVTHIYTLDQYNENTPYSGDLDYLQNVSSTTIASMKAADPDAVWLMQGWLFFSASEFWPNDRIEAYLGGVEDEDMLILDLFSESEPQWQRTNNYYGKPWIWCQLHDYGGNMGLYGQIENVTTNPVQALNNQSSTMVGMGLTMEGQEGNEIMYDLLLDQAWSNSALDTSRYFRKWVSARYHGSQSSLPSGLYRAWDIMRQTVYNNTDLEVSAVTKSIFVLSPNTTGIMEYSGHHATTIQYDPAVLVDAWNAFYGAADRQPELLENEAYRFDLTDITRQVMANAFYPLYNTFLSASNDTLATYDFYQAQKAGEDMLRLLNDLDAVLAASGEEHFSLPAWIASARAWADPTALLPANASTAANSSTVADTASFYEYNARNQITLWGPNGEINDYGSKQWAGLIRSYYVPRWSMFVDYTLSGSTSAAGVNQALSDSLTKFQQAWQNQTWGEALGESYERPRKGELQQVISRVVRSWPDVFKT